MTTFPNQNLCYRELIDGRVYYMLHVLHHIIQIISFSTLSEHHFLFFKKVNLDHPSLVIDLAIIQNNKNVFTFGAGKRI